MTEINHSARAKRLSDLLDDGKVNNDSLTDAGVNVKSDPPVVPYRYAAPTYDGSGVWIEFANDLGEMSTQLEAAIEADYPYAPGTVVDLDTGTEYASVVHVGLPEAQAYRRAMAVLHRLQSGESVTDALAHEGFTEDEDVVSEDSTSLALDDVQNNVIDFCANVLLRRVGAQVKLRDEGWALEKPGSWQLETY
jgi:hypothetical protein